MIKIRENGDHDVDAFARGIRSAFFTDSDGSNTITIQGAIRISRRRAGRTIFGARRSALVGVVDARRSGRCFDVHA